jgi:DnaJ-class molecular chaperone
VHLNEDPYQLLGLTKEASEDDIQRAHRKLVREYHPDVNPKDPRAEERFKEIQQAYEVLSDNKKRREYDQTLNTSSKEASGRPDARGAGAKTRTTGREHFARAAAERAEHVPELHPPAHRGDRHTNHRLNRGQGFAGRCWAGVAGHRLRRLDGEGRHKAVLR